ncbi:divisome-associated lipoprotein YraP [[Haemophilus] felis]|uniref:Osmotically-inducible protein OsmY n=1 Tax=[Haemophilus] felis TaxID=123822 RepID=A0A1T0B6N7_9PAST|nr:divisome-associated lipoprotein YraP [[Haemophilus] felis]NBI39943.1 divisome-associated lipoprotein YraP [[Haemophilus] felis]NBI42250.1 divisome-associated lipoprotein YraP [[Haemophilus] felis]OOS05795.1 osmotically-inducible protein OsmY [[Haemophilus] felis]
MKLNKFKALSLILGSAVLLQGCTAAVIAGGVAVATKVATDPRTVGTQIDDETLEEKIRFSVMKDPQIKSEARVNIVSYGGKVLLIGQAPSQNTIELVTSLTEGVEGVNKVINEMRVGNKISATQIARDGLITSEIKSKLLLDSRVKMNQVKVITENNETFIMGNVTKQQADAILSIASQVSVRPKKVLNVLHYLN